MTKREEFAAALRSKKRHEIHNTNRRLMFGKNPWPNSEMPRPGSFTRFVAVPTDLLAHLIARQVEFQIHLSRKDGDYTCLVSTIGPR